jgi:hypothetical protein
MPLFQDRDGRREDQKLVRAELAGVQAIFLGRVWLAGIRQDDTCRFKVSARCSPSASGTSC